MTLLLELTAREELERQTWEAWLAEVPLSWLVEPDGPKSEDPEFTEEA